MSPQLLRLPNELKLNIFEHLPAKDLQRVRRVCKQLRTLVESNKVNFATSIRQRELSRLNDFLAHHNYASLPFHVALGRWARHRGIWLNTASKHRSMTDFVQYFLGVSAPPGYTYSDTEVIRFGMLAEEFCKIHVAKLIEDVEERRGSGTSRLVQGKPLSDMIRDSVLIDPIFSIFGQTHIAEAIEMILADPQMLGTTIHGEFKIPSRHQKNLLTLTPLARKMGVFGRGVCAEATLVDLLGLPHLPQGEYFAYCITDMKMFEVLRAALHLSAVSLDSLVEAAFLEELFVY